MKARLAHLVLLACLTGALGSAACSSSSAPNEGGDSGPASTPPLSCDAGVASYKSVIVPILQQDCLPCHSPGGVGGFDESTYAEVSAQAGNMLTMVVQGAMPPANGPQMTSAQRVALTDWLECGAPNN